MDESSELRDDIALGGAAERLARLEPAAPGVAAEVARARLRAQLFGDDPQPIRLERYLVLGVLGMGGMGVVYAAYDPELDRKVALKLLHHDTGSDAEARLKREARALARLAHPHVLAVHDVGTVELATSGTHVYVAMELVDGPTLGAWLREQPRSLREKLAIMLQAGRGLAAAHAAGIVHRDFKPENVIIGRDGRARVMDFGLARAEQTEPSDAAITSDSALGEPITRSDAFLGTPAYMAPEQFLGHAVDARADQFAFCVVLFEALCGVRPFEGDSVQSLALAVVEGRVREPPRTASVPRRLHRLLARGLARDPQDRFVGMDALLEALAADPTRKRRMLAGIAGALALASAGVVLWQADRARIRTQCRDDGAAIAAQWNDDVRAELDATMAASGLPFAANASAGAAEWLGRRARAWSEERERTCLGARLERSLDAETYARAEDCFAIREAELGELVEQLRTGERSVLVHAVTAAARLPDPARCSDPAALLRQPRVPADAREQIAAVRARIAKVTALLATAAYRPALAEAEAALADAKAIGDTATLASSELAVGRAADEAGDAELARAALERAMQQAGAAGADEDAAEAAELLVRIVGVTQAHPDEGLEWAKHARMWHDRLGLDADDPHRVELLLHTASVYDTKGDFRQALALGEQALAIQERTLGPDHPDVATLRDRIALARTAGDRSATP